MFTKNEKFNCAIKLHNNGEISKAIKFYFDLLSDDKNPSPHLLFLVGVAYSQLGQFVNSKKFLQKSINLYPNNPLAHFNLGLVLYELGYLERAESCFTYAIELKPNYLEAYMNRGMVFHKLKRFDEALADYDFILKVQIDDYELYSNRAAALRKLGRFNEALMSYDMALKINQSDEKVFSNRGIVLHELKYFDLALLDYEKAIKLNPEFSEAYCNRGVTFNELADYDNALIDFHKAIELNPEDADAYYNCAFTFHKIGEFQKAQYCYDKAINLNVEFIDANWNKALLKILLGEYQEGWRLYEWRWKRKQNKARRHAEKPLWLGETSLENQRLLIWSEQGLGDVVQFCRYALLAQYFGAKITLEVPGQLKKIISSLGKDIRVFEVGEALPDFDLQVPIMSLPLAFETQVVSIPAKIPYLFADADKVECWKKWLGSSKGLRVGLAWSGSVGHANDASRSIQLKSLESVLFNSAEFHSLQIDYRENDLDALIKFPNIVQHQEKIQDFSDTAALIENLDLVISVDTAIAHLAGALGKPVWIMLPFSPDYRWMLDRNDSPWYPTARLFRQHALNDWNSVIKEVQKELEELI